MKIVLQLCCFRYGATLVRDDKIEGGQLLTVLFCVMTAGSQVASAQPSLEAIYKARGAAYYVFDLIKRVYC